MLQQANLSGALLAGARHDGNTRWPDGFDPAAHGALAPGGSPARAGDQKQRQARVGEILVVEDDPSIRRTVTRHSRRTATGSRQQTTAATRRYLADHPPPAVILLDLSMPEMDGWAFRIEQQKDPRLAAVPVVVCSAIYDPAPAAAMARADAFLAKPYDLQMLLDTVRRYCG